MQSQPKIKHSRWGYFRQLQLQEAIREVQSKSSSDRPSPSIVSTNGPGSISLTKKGGRPRGHRNRQPASGSIVAVTECRKGKTYPVVANRVDKDLAWDYPEQFYWLYQWSECDGDGCWRTRSRRVSRCKIYSVRAAIARGESVAEVRAVFS